MLMTEAKALIENPRGKALKPHKYAVPIPITFRQISPRNQALVKAVGVEG